MNLYILRRVFVDDLGGDVRPTEMLVRALDEDDARVIARDYDNDACEWESDSMCTCAVVGMASSLVGGPVLMVGW